MKQGGYIMFIGAQQGEIKILFRRPNAQKRRMGI